tara:strand:- start:1460 stop:3220 length:1761 start_codon:yes stop_codon:yes gene_type:complete
VKKVSIQNIKSSNIKRITSIIAFCSISSSFNPILKADQIANSSIDQRKEIESIKQKNFNNKNNLDSTIKDSFDNNKNNQKKVSEKTIFLKSIALSGNKKFPDKKLLKFFDELIGNQVTFTDLSNSALKIQSLYREKGFVTTRVIIPKQDFLAGNIEIAVIESFLEDIIVKGGTSGTRDYVKYMTSSVLRDNLKNKIFKFDDLERQLLLIKKTDIGQLTSTLSKGSKVGTSLLTINIDPQPINFSAFSNTDISNNLGDYTVGLKSAYTTKTKWPLKFGTSAKYAFPVDDGLLSGVLYLEKPIAKQGLSLNSIYAYSITKTKDLFPSTPGETNNKGTSEYISLGISYPFILKRNTELGIDLATTVQNSHQDLYQNNVYNNNVSTDRIRAIRLGLNGRKSLKRSYNTARFLFSQGIDGWDNTLNSAQIKSNVDSKANFSTYKLDLSRQQYIGDAGLILELKASGQIANSPLPTPEKFSFGGADYGKGFANSHIFGDSGWSSSIKLTKNTYSKNDISISPFIWFDYGATDDLTGEKRESSASTYGFGVGGNFNRDTSYQISLGVPGTDESNPSKTGLDHAILKFNIGLQF